MAFISEAWPALVLNENESLQELTRKLPEGNALPDGFSECPTEVDSSSTQHQEVQLSTEGSKGGGANISGVLSEGFSDPYGVMNTCSERSIVSSGSSDVSVDLNDGSPCSSPSERKKDRRERLRRFPVQLSPPDNLEEELADSPVAGDEVCMSPKGGSVFLSTDNNQCVHNFQDHSTVEEMNKGETETQDGLHVTEHETSPEVDQLIHGTALSAPPLSQQKFNGVQTVEKLHSSLLEDEICDLRKQNEQLTKEKLTTSAQLAKSVLVREKLESLCRELQRHNKQLTDECKRIASEEQQKRLDLSTRFHDAIKDVSAKLEEQGGERMRQIKENELLQEKLIHFTQQYELQEEQYAQQLRTKSLEQQLLEVKLKQQEELHKQGEAKIQLYTEQISQLLKTEQALRERLALYEDKFEQFQEMLTKSNEVFASFKTQMEKMSKTIKKLEKENFTLQKKCEKSDVSLIELVDERANLKKQLETARNQKDKLERLCRTLQAERKQQNLAMTSVADSAAASGSISAAAAFKTEQVVQDE